MFEKRAPGQRGTGGPKKKDAGGPGNRGTGTKTRVRLAPGLRWALLVTFGVAATAAAGYLVAALVFFPAPLLPNERQVARVTGMSEEEYSRRGPEWVSRGAELEEADFRFHPEALFGMVESLKSIVASHG